ncbi:MAG: ribosome biogenesis GTPase YlqF [Planctomycetota bacterium]|jgi:ribosome biogenesis GTPase A
MSIQWFPGHMDRTRQRLKKAMRQTDVVVEVLDARLPQSSGNPMLDRIIKDRARLKLLNKADLADERATALWLAEFNAREHTHAMSISATDGKQVARLPQMIREMAPTRGHSGRMVRVLVVGIPNCGKSTLINTLVGRKVAKVGDEPAVTKDEQQVLLKKESITINDTPGVLWPNLDVQAGAERLAVSGAISQAVVDTHAAGLIAGRFLLERYPDALVARYKLGELPDEPEALLMEIGRKRGCLVSGGEVDTHRAADILVRELRSGKIGRLSLELPSDFESLEDEHEDAYEDDE